jgi:hypothetical protein
MLRQFARPAATANRAVFTRSFCLLIAIELLSVGSAVNLHLTYPEEAPPLGRGAPVLRSSMAMSRQARVCLAAIL